MRQNKWSAGAAAALCGELALILRAGLPLAESLEVMSEDRGGDALLTGLAACVAEGAPLSQAMEESGAFPAYLTAMVACGEKTGRLEEALDALAEHYDSRSRREAGLTAALVQPTLLALAMLAVMVVLLTRVLPVFREIYASLGGTLSAPAARMLAVGQVLNRALPMLAVLLAAVLAFLGAFALCAPFRDRVTALWQRRDRGLARETAAAGIAQALSLGMRSGLPVEESLELAAGLQGENTPAARRCRDISPDIVVHPLCATYDAAHREDFFAARYDYIVDAIDLVSCKLDLIEQAQLRGIPILSALGTGNKLDPSLLRVTDISKTSGCPLARVMRKELRARNIHHLKVVFSPEEPVSTQQMEAPPPGRRSVPASVAWVPSCAGLMMAGAVIQDLITRKE